MHEKYPPYESILITHKITQVIASPIKRVSLTDENKNSENIIQHNNYTYLSYWWKIRSNRTTNKSCYY